MTSFIPIDDNMIDMLNANLGGVTADCELGFDIIVDEKVL